MLDAFNLVINLINIDYGYCSFDFFSQLWYLFKSGEGVNHKHNLRVKLFFYLQKLDKFYLFTFINL